MAYLSTDNLPKLIGEKEVLTPEMRWIRVPDHDKLYKLMQELNCWATFYKEAGQRVSSESQPYYFEQYQIMNKRSKVVYDYIQSVRYTKSK